MRDRPAACAAAKQEPARGRAATGDQPGQRAEDVPLSQVGAELLFVVFSQRYERSSTMVPSNLLFEEWPSVFQSDRLAGVPLDRLTHHVQILELNGDSTASSAPPAASTRPPGRSKTRLG
jgi:IstB-like ATP binding protein